ncbi:FAD-binding dehydrogenase [Corynebacterium heidelbergense]|uniref:FAD-binding dehydrogenase n=1 Tax=Corynebacterium heidelbergense TaxID=2055947 RepID=A0A364V7I2_9CORY|nr:FAD-binding dehydrogenase [Corynebacterium heidelbergense]RAV32581.1 FAD-binding dehydrogenase [Corynebacterium heidelbergense]
MSPHSPASLGNPASSVNPTSPYSSASTTGPGGFDPDVIVIGAGLAGLVTAFEATRSGLRVLILDQENRANLGGQAFWSLGGLFLVDSPEQRLMGVHDSEELAWRDWCNSANFDTGPEGTHDQWARRWAREYVRFATHDKRRYLRNLGLRVLPTVGWAERGSGQASGHGNSVPRFHLTWGTGPEVVRVFAEPLAAAEQAGTVRYAFRHRVDEVITEVHDGQVRVVGVRGVRLEECGSARGQRSSRRQVGQFEYRAAATVVASGGVGGNLDLVRRLWPTQRWGQPPQDMVCGVPAHVDGRMLEIAERSGASLVNTDRMWHYPEGMLNWDSIWPMHGIRIIPGPSSFWVDATGQRLPSHIIPGGDNLAGLAHVGRSGHGYSWFIFNQTIADKEFMFSGSEQNPDLTDKSLRKLAGKLGKQTHVSVRNFMDHGADWVIAHDLGALVEGMNDLVRRDAASHSADDPGGSGVLIDAANLRRQMEDRDSQIDNRFAKDYQVNYIRMARGYLGDRIVRCAPPHKLLDPAHGPLVAVRIRILTRKTLGGLQTDLAGRCLTADGRVLPGLYAAGEVSGFGGGGMHGHNALEGTFLGGCIHSSKRVGEALGLHVGKGSVL